MTTEIIAYDAMIKAINTCESVYEAKDIGDKARALQRYFKQSRNFDAENKAASVRVRADRRCGQLLAKAEKSKGGRPKNSGGARRSSFGQTKKQAGITDTQAKDFQKLAKIPDKKFEAALSEQPIG